MRFLILISISVGFVNSLSLKCDFVTSGWYVTGEIKNCYTNGLNILSQYEEIESVNGGFQQQTDVKGFWVENEVCHFVPREIIKFFPRLIAFGISNSGLKSISKTDLQPFTEIVRFVLYRNKIEYLQQDLFDYNKKLQSVSFTENNLIIIGESIFNNLPLLRQGQIVTRCFSFDCSTDCVYQLKRKTNSTCYLTGFIELKEETERLRSRNDRQNIELNDLKEKLNECGKNITSQRLSVNIFNSDCVNTTELTGNIDLLVSLKKLTGEQKPVVAPNAQVDSDLVVIFRELIQKLENQAKEIQALETKEFNNVIERK